MGIRTRANACLGCQVADDVARRARACEEIECALGVVIVVVHGGLRKASINSGCQ